MRSPVGAGRLSWKVFWVVATVLSASILLPQEATATFSCERDWQYVLNSLQNARRQLGLARKNPRLTWGARIDCADQILESSGLGGSFGPCVGCSREYAGLLADVAADLRKASGRVKGRFRQRYLEKEVRVRRRLHDFLLEKDQRDLQARYLGPNLRDLASAMYLTKKGEDYHKLLAAYHWQVTSLGKGPDRIAYLDVFQKQNREVWNVWILALRSCPSWDFRIVPDNQRLKVALCGGNCRQYLAAVYKGLKLANVLGEDGRGDTSLPSMPIPADCSPPTPSSPLPAPPAVTPLASPPS